MRVRDWRVRTKLGVVLVIPSLAFLLVGGVQLRGLASQYSVLDDFAQQVAFAQQVTALAHELQGERDRTVGELAVFEASGRRGGPGLLSTAVRDQRAVADQAMTDFRATGAALSRGSQPWREAYDEVIRRLDALSSVREGVRTGNLPFRAAFDVYNRTVDAMVDLLAAPTPGAEYPDLARAYTGYVELARTKEIGSRLRGRIFAVAAAQRFAPGDYVEIADLSAQRLAALDRFRDTAPIGQIDRYDTVVAGEPQRVAEQMEQLVVDTGGRSVPALDGSSWWRISTAQHDLVREAERELVAAVAATAGARSADQRDRTLLVAGAALFSLLIALVISAVIGRSMARSLRVLRDEALHVAQLELPQAIDQLRDVGKRDPHIDVKPPSVQSSDEIGEVAEAFRAVHRSAVTLALEQAVTRRNVNSMFVNLARRSQVLVERQLELLDSLERDERDPEVLGNLFKLDHLAARMRRNDESLLVLAGNEGNRRWRAPISLSEVILAALAEIEQYTRVQHAAADSLYVGGHAVADVVHVLAELLENATVFSPPDTRVQVVGLERGGRTALVEITDEGLGMSRHAIEAANTLLASPPAADVAASERMGLFVVSHLAARHGIRVELRASERGTVASVWLPPDILASAPDPLAPESEPAQVLSGAALAGVPAGGPVAIPVPVAGSVPVAGVGSAAVAAGPVAVGAAATAVRGGGTARLPDLPPIHVNLTLALPPGRQAGAPGGPGGAADDAPAGAAEPVLPTAARPVVSPTAARPVVSPTAASPTTAARPAAPTAKGVVAGPAEGLVPGRPRRGLPATGGGRHSAASAWWSRSAAASAPPLAPAPVGPPAVPIIGGVNERGLPVRVP
ncbi:MAG TPA: nitrate- and nitrite sensing domain-containing protein, partial [Pilimelia sp.]|nr:nitrate- and nitrite sensing domain-containing protein [Pilimelia sp.]